MEAGAVDRTLLEGRGTELYETAVAEGGFAVDDPRIVAGGELHDAFQLLVSLGLLHHESDDGTRWMPDDPGTAQSRVVAPLSLEGTRLLQVTDGNQRVLLHRGRARLRALLSEELAT